MTLKSQIIEAFSANGQLKALPILLSAVGTFGGSSSALVGLMSMLP